MVSQDGKSNNQKKEAVSLREKLAAVVRLDRESIEAEEVITEDKGPD